MGSNSIDEIDCASFFDQIDDLIEFPPENECEDVNVGGDLVNSGNDIPSMWTGELPSSNDIFANNSASDLSAELSVPYEEIAQLEWLSTFVEDSFADHKNEIPCLNKKDLKVNNFQTSSPVSVLESSSSSSGSSVNSSSITKTTNVPLCGTQRARSKRPRPPTFNPRPPIQLVETMPPITVSFESFVESSSGSQARKFPELSGPKPKKKKKSKAVNVPGEVAQDGSAAQATRKCMHCEITKTPQWRAGPMGPKTLCNACGVRFKSGRLFPEYRPAASPTFVPAVHSNSHKKVLEMRNKAGHGGDVAPAPVVSEKPEPEGLVTE